MDVRETLTTSQPPNTTPYVRQAQRVYARQAVIADFFNELPAGVSQGVDGFDFVVDQGKQRLPIFDGSWLIYADDGTPQNVCDDAFFQQYYRLVDETAPNLEAQVRELTDKQDAARRVIAQLREEVIRLNQALDAERAQGYAARRGIAAVLRVPAQHPRDDGARVILLDRALIDRLTPLAQE